MEDTKIDKLNYQLNEVKKAFEIWQKSGLNKELLQIYIMHKTKLPKKKVRDVLMAQQKFFDELIRDEVMKRLTK